MPVVEGKKQSSSIRPSILVPRSQGIPELQNGDRLTQLEFERRYETMPHVKKAELIEGVVHMSTPTGDAHGWAHGQIMGWLAAYCAATPGVRLNDNTTVRLDPDNEVQPDALLRLTSESRGQSRVSEDGYIEGAPEFIAEIAYSSASYDLHDKLHVYRRNGVQEYLVWQVYDNRLEWFYLQEGRYVSLLPDANGIIHS
jgi:Uma2 family endonuclease